MRDCDLRDRKVATANMPGRNDPSRIRQNDAHFGRTRVGIKDPRNVGDLAVINLVGIGIQPDFGGVTQMHVAEIVFIDVAQHPHLAEIGDGKQIGTIVEALDPFES